MSKEVTEVKTEVKKDITPKEADKKFVLSMIGLGGTVVIGAALSYASADLGLIVAILGIIVFGLLVAVTLKKVSGTLKYKSYEATFHSDAKGTNNVYYGRIRNIEKDNIVFIEGKTYNELQKDFETKADELDKNK